MISKKRMRLTIDSCISDELVPAKLADLHRLIVEQLWHLEIAEYIKVTMEYDSGLYSEQGTAVEGIIGIDSPILAQTIILNCR